MNIDFIFGTRPFSHSSIKEPKDISKRLADKLDGDAKLVGPNALYFYHGSVQGESFSFQLKKQGFNGGMCPFQATGKVIAKEGGSVLEGKITMGKSCMWVFKALLLLLPIAGFIFGVVALIQGEGLTGFLVNFGSALGGGVVLAAFMYAVNELQRRAEGKALELMLAYAGGTEEGG